MKNSALRSKFTASFAGNSALNSTSSVNFTEYSAILGENSALNSATSTSSLNLSDFCKKMTVQELNEQGFKKLAPSVEILAENEKLHAHKRATSIRLKALK